MEGEGTEAAGRHQELEGETAASGELPDVQDFSFPNPGSSNTSGVWRILRLDVLVYVSVCFFSDVDWILV